MDKLGFTKEQLSQLQQLLLQTNSSNADSEVREEQQMVVSGARKRKRSVPDAQNAVALAIDGITPPVLKQVRSPPTINGEDHSPLLNHPAHGDFVVKIESHAATAPELHPDKTEPWHDVDWKAVVRTMVDKYTDSDDDSDRETDADRNDGDLDDETLVKLLVSRGILDRSKVIVEAPQSKLVAPYYEVLHVVKCCRRPDASITCDSEAPFVGQGGHLVSKNRISSLSKHVKDNPSLAFIIFRDYKCCKRAGQPFQVSEEPIADFERLYINASELCDELNRLVRSSPRESIYTEFECGKDFRSPQAWAYHFPDFRNLCHLPYGDFSRACEEHGHVYLRLFLQYFRDHKIAEFEQIDQLHSQKQIKCIYLDYFFTPGTLIVHARRNLRPEATRVSQLDSWPKVTHGFEGYEMPLAPSTGEGKLQVDISSFWWDFDGNFQRVPKKDRLMLDIFNNPTLPVKFVEKYPLKFADESFRSLVQWRGKMLWACRVRGFVQYTGPDAAFNHLDRVRLMVDNQTYKRHSPPTDSHLRDDLGEAAMAAEIPLNAAFLSLLPPITAGYNLQEKKWVKLFTSFMAPVQWDRDAFEQIVIGYKTRELVMALVSSQVSSVKTSDIIEGKGNGLIVLLHGGPGTGKTLTAESVAEHARKPLYRVTCGDIGVEPEKVERYLKEVLYLGKLWDCVVLLDEAEVFLQERSLSDLPRNALVAVFLRILEYYDGIMILTSNRVGVFDEGFKSRIHLSIHYDKLDLASRKQIWQNFIDRLESTEKAPINLTDLKRHLNDLSRFDLNGREIRNSIKLARQLAFFRGDELDFKCIKHVVGVSNQFEDYLKKLENPQDAKEAGFRNE